jgi:ABC-2 type transport system ATP-binding protein
MKRRLEIARGPLHQPRVLFLDEPTIGLDPQTRQHIWNYVDKLRAETSTTVFLTTHYYLTTHYMDEAERCDRIAIIDHGKIVALDTLEGLKSMVGGDVISLKTSNNARAAAILRERFGVEPTEVNGVLRLEVNQGDAFIPSLVRELTVPIQTVSVRRPSLDDIFLRVTGREMRCGRKKQAERIRCARGPACADEEADNGSAQQPRRAGYPADGERRLRRGAVRHLHALVSRPPPVLQG